MEVPSYVKLITKLALRFASFEKGAQNEQWRSWLPRSQAHRGFHIDGTYPENTLIAMQNAQSRGARMIECDLQLSSDGIPVLFHDVDLFRIYKNPKSVKEVSLAELRGLGQFTDLESLLSAVKEGLELYLNLELKTKDVKDHGLEAQVMALVRKYDLLDRVLISSFNPFALNRVKRLEPSVPRAFLASPDVGYFLLRHMWILPFFSFHLLHLDQTYLNDPDLKSDLIRFKVPFAVWTVNEQPVAQDFLQIGAVSLITDNPDLYRL